MLCFHSQIVNGMDPSLQHTGNTETRLVLSIECLRAGWLVVKLQEVREREVHGGQMRHKGVMEEQRKAYKKNVKM